VLTFRFHVQDGSAWPYSCSRWGASMLPPLRSHRRSRRKP